MNSVPSANRIHIGFFGLRNMGKSSLVNRVTNQEISVVSDVKGTTTDPVKKAMELLPLGPVVITDTPGFDDEGELGLKRVEKTKEILEKTDIAVLVTSPEKDLTDTERELIDLFTKNEIPYIIAVNKSDLFPHYECKESEIKVSALTGDGVDELKEKIGSLIKEEKEPNLVSDILPPNATAVLVVPIDKSAPKSRLILPQQQVIRDLLDHGLTAIVTRDDTYEQTLSSLKGKPDIVICDSQVFSKVNRLTPSDVRLTSFSIIMARMKGFLSEAVQGANELDSLKDGDKILICEACTHHRQCEDIGTVKLPRWISEYTGKKIEFQVLSGKDFPKDLSPYRLIIHCGGCMITEREVLLRMRKASEQGVPFTNYGTVIAKTKGILERSTEMFK